MFDRRSALNYELAGVEDLVARRHVGVSVVDLNDEICGPVHCPPVVRGMVAYTDPEHLTATFSRTLAPALATALRARLPGLGR